MTTDKTLETLQPQPLPPHVAEKLLRLLSTEDGFRELFVSDPATALIQAGYRAAAQDTGSEDLRRWATRLKIGQLAPKAVIQQAHAELKASLTQGLNMQPIVLNASDGNRYIRRD